MIHRSSKHGLVDIIIPTFECKPYLPGAIKSIESQTYDHSLVKVTVVDDGSTDGSVDLLRKIQTRSPLDIQILESTENRGANHARNLALEATNGEFTYFMDADSLLAPNAIECLVKALRGSKGTTPDGYRIAFAYSPFQRIWLDPNGPDDPARTRTRVDVFPSAPYDFARLMHSNYISMMSLVRREVLPESGFDETVERFQDWDLWLTLHGHGYVGTYVKELLFAAFIRPQGISRDQEAHDRLQKVVRDRHLADDVMLPNSVTPDSRERLSPFIVSENIRELERDHKAPEHAVFTLTMDRLEYTQRMLEALRSRSTQPYVHVVVDQAPNDGTIDYFTSLEPNEKNPLTHVIRLDRNIGISAGSNLALDTIMERYPSATFITKLDNDCEVLDSGWDTALMTISRTLSDTVVLSPFVEGLRENRGGAPRYAQTEVQTETGAHQIGLTSHLGGICELAHRRAYDGFRFDEGDTLSGHQDSSFSAWVVSHGYRMAYAENIRCTHMDTTDGQHAKYPDYFSRRTRHDSVKCFSDIVEESVEDA